MKYGGGGGWEVAGVMVDLCGRREEGIYWCLGFRRGRFGVGGEGVEGRGRWSLLFFFGD